MAELGALGNIEALAAQPERTAAAIADLCERATEAWPNWITTETLTDHLATVLGGDDSPLESLESVRTDIYLCAAVLFGVGAAVATLEALVNRLAPPICRRLGGDAASAADAASDVLEKLTVGGDRGPRIADYGGRGSIDGWLRATISRTHLNRMRKHKREVLIGDRDALEALHDDHVDPSLAHLKAQYREQFKRAFERAIEALTPRQRGVLRYRFVDGATVETIAAVYSVHRATCHRWLGEARAALARHTEAELASELAQSDVDIESIRALIESQLELSLSRVFADS